MKTENTRIVRPFAYTAKWHHNTTVGAGVCRVVFACVDGEFVEVMIRRSFLDAHGVSSRTDGSLWTMPEGVVIRRTPAGRLVFDGLEKEG